MKLSNAVLLSAVFMVGTSFAVVAQDRDNPRWNNGDGYLQTVQYNGAYRNNNGDYQRGFQDGINSGRADANGNKRANLGSHPYYTNSNNPAYRDGFAQGYREAYGQGTGRNGAYGNNGYYGDNGGYYGNGPYQDSGGYYGGNPYPYGSGYQTNSYNRNDNRWSSHR